jgi:DNA polymerase-3 subunit delta'
MLFQHIPGLAETKKILINSVKSNHIAHAQLFFGPAGSANLAMALAYATYINCTDKQDHDACGHCAACIKNNKYIFPDLHFVVPTSSTKSKTKDITTGTFMKEWREFIQTNPYANMQEWGNYFGAENKQLSISVEESRSIIKTLTLKSFEGEYKILILWLPEMMNASSANALLKILEEPPAKTIFLLVTQDPGKIITTIISRTQMVRIRVFKEEEIIEKIIQSGIGEETAKKIAYLADGDLNEAFRISHEVDEGNEDMFRTWMRLCYSRDFGAMVQWSEDFTKMGREGQKNFFQYGLNMLRETLILRYGGEDLLRLQDEEKKFIENFSKVLDQEKIEYISKEISSAHYHIERNANPKIIFLDLSLSISLKIK